MNEEAMRKHYERTPKETLINILISSREQVEKLQKRNKERKQEIERLNNIINESAEEILKELEENNHLSFGVALAIRQKLLDYKELKGSDKE